MMVAVGQAALAFERQVEILDPVALWRDPAARSLDAQRKAARHRHHDRVVRGGDLRRKSWRPGLAMMVAAIGEQCDRQARRFGLRRLQQPPGDIGRVRTRLHPDALLDAARADREAPYRDRAVEREALD